MKIPKRAVSRGNSAGLVSGAELARRLKLSRQRVSTMDKLGMGRDGANLKGRPLYNVERCRAWYQESIATAGHGGDRSQTKSHNPSHNQNQTPAAPPPLFQAVAPGPAPAPDPAAATLPAPQTPETPSASTSLTAAKAEREWLIVNERRLQLAERLGRLGDRHEMLRLATRAAARLRDLIERECRRLHEDLGALHGLDDRRSVLQQQRIRETVETIRRAIAADPFGAAAAAAGEQSLATHPFADHDDRLDDQAGGEVGDQEVGDEEIEDDELDDELDDDIDDDQVGDREMGDREPDPDGDLSGGGGAPS